MRVHKLCGRVVGGGGADVVHKASSSRQTGGRVKKRNEPKPNLNALWFPLHISGSTLVCFSICFRGFFRVIAF